MNMKTADKKGRVQLGQRYANKVFIVEEIDETEVRLTEAAVIPKREIWLHKNTEAKKSVMRGIEDARQGRFANGPDLQEDSTHFDCSDDE